MRVKKFEAKTMKEALQMVKLELGPDAVILAAKDNRNRFGLVGEGSVEITAAVSESTLHKKRFAESRLRDEDRERFQSSTARSQKQVIEKMAERRLQAAAHARAQVQQLAQEAAQQANSLNSLGTQSARPGMQSKSSRPITSVSYIDIEDDSPQENYGRGNNSGGLDLYTSQAPAQRRENSRTNRAAGTEELTELKGEIQRLQEVIRGFQKMPQSFIPSYPGAEHGVGADFAFMYQKLVEAGILPEVATEILKAAQASIDPIHAKKRTAVDAWVARRILDSTQLVSDPFKGRIHAFVGPSGAGKTASVIKFASHLVVNENKKVAIITGDTQKVGAVDQMKIFCRILNVPFAMVRNRNDWEWVLTQLSNVDYILFDSPGLQLREIDEIHKLKAMLPPELLAPTTHLVLSATSKDSDASEMARRYRAANVNDVIFTNLDQSVQHGVIYNFQLKNSLPLHSFGIGPRIPEDFEPATKERVLDLIFKLTKLRKES
jgi:flagellar biosynthesis protein FlhF